MRIGFFQFSPFHGNKEKNIEIIINILKRGKADLIVFPELATSGYLIPDKNFLRKNAFKVPDSKEFEMLLKVVKKEKTGIVLGFPELKDGKFFNSALFILPDGKFGVYRKIHLFYKEKKFFKSGKNPDEGIFTYIGFKFGIIICFDWLFPEHLRYLAYKGIQVVLHPSNLILPWGQRAMIIRAIENRVFTLTANRVGEEKYRNEHLKFTGKSQLVSPDGRILMRANSGSEVLRIKEINPAEANRKLITPYNDIFEDLKTVQFKYSEGKTY